MRNQYSWYFPVTDQEKKNIWETGTCTVDANVLLDLYRYHKDTQYQLITCLEEFKGRLWLPRQAADEFFRNRKKVILEATSGFKRAIDEIEKLRKTTATAIDRIKYHPHSGWFEVAPPGGA